ncbi:Uncharacterised protein [uncultured archaeon]|nr:Uncharacterised protein [uncultured archaeon]
MTCYMTGFGSALFLSTITKGIVPRKPKKNSEYSGGEEE